MSCSFKTIVAVMLVSGSVASAETLVERGEYLVEGPGGCGNCHTAPVPGSPSFGGNSFPDLMSGARVMVEVPNITPGSRIADWSDAELARSIREGVRPDGSLVGPPMPIPLYRGLSDNDLAAIVAYLRTLEPVEGELRLTEYPFPLPPDYGPPVSGVADIPRGATVEYGAYLAGPVAHCMDCHSLTPEGVPDFETNLGGGGRPFEGPWGVAMASNLTSHDDGLAGYSDSEIAAMIREGKRPDGSDMLPPMPYHLYAKITDEDVAAIVTYLRTLPPLPDA